MYRNLFTVLSFSLLSLGLFWSSSQAAAETIGPWEISDAPITASQVSGSAGSVLNIVNSLVSVNDALSGVSLLDDGIANAVLDDEFQLDYAAGIALNSTGADLVIFDAAFVVGSYAVTTSHDAYATEVLFPATSFVDSGVDRDYFFNAGGFAFMSDIWGAEIDLSLLGVPSGVAVNSIRVRATNNDTDLIGVGVIAVPEPTTVSLLAIGLLGLGYSRRR